MAIESTQTAPRPLPIWLSIPIILLCLMCGGWIIYLYVMTDPTSHESKILGDPPARVAWQGGNRPRQNTPLRREVQDQGKGKWDLRTETAHANLTVGKARPVINIIAYMNYSFVPGDSIKTILSARVLAGDKNRVAALKLAPEQTRKLEQLSARITMLPSPADKERLISAVTACNAADPGKRPAMESGLLQLLDEIADRSMDATRKEAMDHANQVNQIITPDMWKRVNSAAK